MGNRGFLKWSGFDGQHPSVQAMARRIRMVLSSTSLLPPAGKRYEGVIALITGQDRMVRCYRNSSEIFEWELMSNRP